MTTAVFGHINDFLCDFDGGDHGIHNRFRFTNDFHNRTVMIFVRLVIDELQAFLGTEAIGNFLNLF